MSALSNSRDSHIEGSQPTPGLLQAQLADARFTHLIPPPEMQTQPTSVIIRIYKDLIAYRERLIKEEVTHPEIPGSKGRPLAQWQEELKAFKAVAQNVESLVTNELSSRLDDVLLLALQKKYVKQTQNILSELVRAHEVKPHMKTACSLGEVKMYLALDEFPIEDPKARIRLVIALIDRIPFLGELPLPNLSPHGTVSEVRGTPTSTSSEKPPSVWARLMAWMNEDRL